MWPGGRPEAGGLRGSSVEAEGLQQGGSPSGPALPGPALQAPGAEEPQSRGDGLGAGDSKALSNFPAPQPHP